MWSTPERQSISPLLSVLRLTSPMLSASKSLMAVPQNTPPGRRTHLIEAAQLGRKLRSWSINCTKWIKSHVIKDAIRQANISNQDTVLDIGAGKGFLTVHLLKIANNVVAIENDTALVEHLRKLFSDAQMFKLSVVILGILQFRNFLSKWCQIFLMALLPIFSKSWCLRVLEIFWEVPLSFN